MEKEYNSIKPIHLPPNSKAVEKGVFSANGRNQNKLKNP